jgi:hypothetical protein
MEGLKARHAIIVHGHDFTIEDRRRGPDASDSRRGRGEDDPEIVS